MTENLELIKFTRLYLGKTNWEFMKKTSNKELALFQKFPIDLSKSYLVLGTENLLNKFRAFYLTRCTKERPLYAQYLMHDYASELSSATRDENGLNINMDLVFLYRHKHQLTLGRSEDWLIETILNKVANRNREGLSTVILSELRMPLLETCGELQVINLSGITGGSKSEAIKEIVAKNISVTNSSGTDFS